MIAGIFHSGSGLGDMLHRYITVRTLAEDKGFEWGMVHSENFKGASFMDLKTPTATGPFRNMWNEKDVRENGVDIRSYDPEINFIEDNTIIDGYFEDSKYWCHNLKNIDTWLKVEPLEVADDVCVIGFRGGEFYSDPNLGLPKEYYWDAIEQMQRINPMMTFEVHTDDKHKAAKFFAGFPTIQEIGSNWRSMRYAKHAIIANSAFYILPRLLSGGVTIAPRYWARRNTKGPWRPSAYYKQFIYV